VWNGRNSSIRVYPGKMRKKLNQVKTKDVTK
jgi:hypothetical protein